MSNRVRDGALGSNDGHCFYRLSQYPCYHQLMALTLGKLTQPDVGNAVLRERLIARMDTARTQPLIWISAPAGAGKTTLAASYIASQGAPCLWYQMDGGDADPATFFHYLGRAAKGAGQARRKLPMLSPEYQLGIAEFARNYFHEVFQRLGPSGVLVLDNFQDTGAEFGLHDMLAGVFDEIPAGINVIVVSRRDPPCTFARLLANRSLCLIGWDELRFTVDEGLSIASKLYPNRDISLRQLEHLNEHIQGWMTGLILWLAQGAELDTLEFDGEELSQEYLFDYFFAEIFRKLDTGTRQFLIETAMLPKMTATICKRLTGNAAAKKILTELVHKQQFTVRHGALRPSYEYHPLFREFLRNQAREQLGDDGYRELKSRAGVSLADSGSMDAAADLLTQGENWPALCELILKHARKQIECGRHRRVAQWISALPAEAMEGRPWLMYWQGMSYLQYDNDAARDGFEKAYGRFKAQGDVPGLYLSWCGIADAYTFAHASFAGAEHWLKELEWLQQAHPKPPGMEVRGHLIFSAAQLMFWVQPSHPSLPGWMAKMETIYRFVPNKFLVVMSIVQLSIYNGQMGETPKVRNISKRIEKLVSSVDDNLLLKALLLMTRYANDWMTADFALSYESIDDSQRRINAEGVKTFSGLMLAHALYHAACQHDLPRMKTLLDAYGEIVNGESPLDMGHYQLHLGYYQLLRDDFGAAIRHCNAAVELVEQAHAPLPVWVSHSMLACAFIEADEFASAEKHLGRVHRVVGEIGTPASAWVYYMVRSYLAYRQDDSRQMLEYLGKCFHLGREKDMNASAVWPPRMVSTLCGVALEHDIEPDYARQIIHRYGYTPAHAAFAGEHWPWPLRIYTLGRFGVLVDGEAIDADSRPFDLLKILLACGGRDVHVDKLTDVLWPESDGDQARASFKMTLLRLRRMLGARDVLPLKNHRLSLDQHYVWVDTWAMSRLFERAERCAKSKDATQGEWLADKLMQYYRGHFLVNESATWASLQRDRLRQRFVRHVAALVRFIEPENSLAATRCYQRVLELDPLAETAYQGLIRCYLSQGLRLEAQACYDSCAEMLATHGGHLPSPATADLLKS